MQGKKHIPARSRARLHMELRQPERKLIEDVTAKNGFRTMTAMVLSAVRLLRTVTENEREGGKMMLRTKQGTYTGWNVGV